MSAPATRRLLISGLAFSSLFLAAAGFLITAKPPLVSTPPTAGEDVTPAGLTPSEWSGIQAKIRADRYAVSRDGQHGAWTASNPANDLRTEFAPSGIRVVPRRDDSTWQLGLRLTAFGYEGQLRPVAPVAPTADGNRVEYARGALTEWYVNAPDGLEQGFTLAEPPAWDETGGREPDWLRFDLTLDGAFRAEQGDDGALTLRPPEGTAELRYDGLRVWDAAGRDLPARLMGKGSTIAILVDDREAIYPLTIDPTLTQQAKLHGDGGGTGPGSPGSRFGGSVAVSGDTMVVGARYDGLVDAFAGAAYVFVRSGANWTLQQTLTASDGESADNFGQSVAISGDTVVVGTDGDDDAYRDEGAAYVFVRMGTTWSQQQKLTAADGRRGDRFGSSVAMLGDTVVVGAEGDSDAGVQSGSAYVFVRAGTTWSQQAKLTASDASAFDRFGGSVAVSGNTVVVGTDGDDDAGSQSGAAYVFVRTGTTWSQQQKLTATDAAGGDRFGRSVAVSGETVVVGAYRALIDEEEGWRGAAYVFVRSGSIWSQQQKLARAAGGDDRFGFSVAVSGETAVVGAYREPVYQGEELTQSGAAYVFVRSGTTWSEQQKLTASDAAAYDEFGWSVAVSGDTAVIGAYGDDDAGIDSGSAYAFVSVGGFWSEQEKVLGLASAAGDAFGSSVAVSGDTVLVGAFGDDDGDSASGSAYVFHWNGQDWSLQQKLTATDASLFDHFGRSVAVSGDTIVIGAEGDDGAYRDQGAAYVFIRTGATWSQQQKLTATDAARSDYFGSSVAVSGDTIVIGAGGDQRFTGSAYVYVSSGTAWSEQQKLTAADAARGDEFGDSVAVSGDTVIVGALHDDDAGASSGSAYVFTRTGATWSQQQKLTAADAARFDNFGDSVAVSGDTVLVGAFGDDDGGSASGSAYVFHWNGQNWSLQQKLTATDASLFDHFGRSVAVSGDTIVIGADGDDGAYRDQGAAYVFIRTGATWSQQQKLTATDAARSDYFGSSVSVSGDTVVVGAWGNDDDGGNSGSAYVFAPLIPSESPPTVDAGPDAVIDDGGPFVSSGSFDDPGSESWTATVDYGEGAGEQTLALNPDNTFALNHTYADKGIYTVTVCVTDNAGSKGCDSATVTNYLTTTIAVQDMSAQYSDSVLKSATLTDALGRPIAGAELMFDVSGICSGTATTDGSGTARRVCGPLSVGAGPRTIDVSFTEGTPPLLRGSTGQGTLDVLHEQTEIDYDRDNPLSVRVASDGGDSPYFELTAHVEELFPDAAGVDQTGGSLAAYGDINLAEVTMELVPIGPGSPYSATCAVDAVAGTGYDTVLTATCGFSGVDVETYSVYTRIAGDYYEGEIEEPLTVYDPSLGFATGGGWFYWPDSDDPPTGYPGDKTNYGFTMKYNPGMTNIRGSLLVIRHLPDGTKYRIKSNALDGLALGESTDAEGSYGWADFSGKCTYLEPGMDDPEGNYWFVAYVEDRNEPGIGTDRFWQQVKDKDRVVVPDLSFDEPAYDNKIPIDGGNIQVPHACTPQCDGKTCGSDLCGGTCGTCLTGEFCDALTQVCCTADADGDGVCDENDCAPNDPGAYGLPGEVDTLWFGTDKTTLSWTPLGDESGSGVYYDVCRGSVAELPLAGGPSEVCLDDDTASTQTAAVAVPGSGEGLFYLVRGDNGCGAGTYGEDSGGNERTSTVCP